MRKVLKVADVSSRMRVQRLVLTLGMFCELACGGPQPAATAESTAPSQLKPAEARPAPAAEEPATLEPAELPRGISAPQPDARDLATGSNTEPAGAADVASAAVPKAPVKPKPAAATPPESTQLAAKPAPPKPSHVPSSKPALRPSEPPPAPPAAVEPVAPVAPPPPPPPPAPKASVTVPHTDHVHVDVPPGLQHWLDEDDRMRPWLGKAVNIVDSCYAKVRADDANASGAIAFVVTMHENARPSGSVSSVSGPINSIVMCATRGLFGVKMPLFTGKEGESHSVRVRFDP